MTRPLHLDIAGMSCAHCVVAVKKELSRLDGVSVKEVVLDSADLTYDDAKTSPEAITKAVQDAGYAVTHAA